MNTATPKILMERGGLALEQAGLGTSTYFAARTIGALTGAILLAKFSAKKFLTQLVKNATQKTKKCTNFDYFIL